MGMSRGPGDGGEPSRRVHRLVSALLRCRPAGRPHDEIPPPPSPTNAGAWREGATSQRVPAPEVAGAVSQPASRCCKWWLRKLAVGADQT